MQTKHLHLRHGGDVLSIERIGHSTYKKVAEWFYICTVKWPDTGKTSAEVCIVPTGLCHDGTPEGDVEWREAADKLNRYLALKGKWHEPKRVGEYQVHWTPKQPKGSTKIEAIVILERVAA